MQVAVKAIHDGGLDRDPGAVLQEAMTLDGMKHLAIIGLRDCGFADEIGRRRPYLVMEYFDGPTLQTYVEQGGPIPLNDLLPLAEILGEALAAAHTRGVLHRDVKPAMSREPGGQQPARLGSPAHRLWAGDAIGPADARLFAVTVN